jgi:Methyltransferase FkbM domain
MIALPDFGALDFLKLDLEGYETDALEGCVDQLKRYRPVVLIEEKNLPHKALDYSARRLLESLDFREVARSGRDVVFA